MTKRVVLFAAAASLMCTSAVAQQHQQTPSEQALGQKLLQEIQAGLTCSANLLIAQAELVKAQARIKELELKASPDAKQ